MPRTALTAQHLFDAMVAIGFYLLLIPLLFLLLLRLKRSYEYGRWMLGGILLGGPLSMLAIELGWYYAEVGRQPWILRGYMRVSEVATTNENVGFIFVLFVLLYILLGTVSIIVLSRLFRNKPAEMELEDRRIIL